MFSSIHKESYHTAKRKDISTKAVPFPPAQNLKQKNSGFEKISSISNLRRHVARSASSSACIEIPSLDMKRFMSNTKFEFRYFCYEYQIKVCPKTLGLYLVLFKKFCLAKVGQLQSWSLSFCHPKDVVRL